jgi:hypothetical protein
MGAAFLHAGLAQHPQATASNLWTLSLPSHNKMHAGVHRGTSRRAEGPCTHPNHSQPHTLLQPLPYQSGLLTPFQACLHILPGLLHVTDARLWRCLMRHMRWHTKGYALPHALTSSPHHPSQSAGGPLSSDTMAGRRFYYGPRPQLLTATYTNT